MKDAESRAEGLGRQQDSSSYSGARHPCSLAHAVLAPQDTALYISSKSTTCLQGHQSLTQTPHRHRPHRDTTRWGVVVIPCCTAGAERLAEGLGDRSLERTEPAAERAAGLGLAVGSTEACREEEKSIKGERRREGGEHVNHTRHSV